MPSVVPSRCIELVIEQLYSCQFKLDIYAATIDLLLLY